LTTVEDCEDNRRADNALATCLSRSGSTPPVGSTMENMDEHHHQRSLVMVLMVRYWVLIDIFTV